MVINVLQPDFLFVAGFVAGFDILLLLFVVGVGDEIIVSLHHQIGFAELVEQ